MRIPAVTIAVAFTGVILIGQSCNCREVFWEFPSWLFFPR